MNSLRIVRGVPTGQRTRAAELYWEAFAGKLSPALGDAARGVPLLAGQLEADRFLCAVVGDRVVGVLGFHSGGTSGFEITHRALAARYSPWSAWLRLLLLAPLDRSPRAGELLLDGVCVDAAARGRGVGTLLLDEAAVLARETGARAIRLSVVDTNPRARALYERLGYRAERTEHLGALGRLYGIAEATAMVRPLADEEGVV